MVMLKQEYSIAKIGADAAEDGPNVFEILYNVVTQFVSSLTFLSLSSASETRLEGAPGGERRVRETRRGRRRRRDPDGGAEPRGTG